jgi:multiple sugar transport system permease protein
LRNRTLPAQVLVALTQSPMPFQFAGGFILLAPALVVVFVIRRYLFDLWGRVSR